MRNYDRASQDRGVCPIRADRSGNPVRCMGYDCEWWDVDRCVIRSVGGALDRISDTLNTMSN